MTIFAKVPIQQLVDTVANWNPLKAKADEVFTYIDLSAVSQDTKSIVAANEIACPEAPSRARQLVASGDVLVSTVRPNLNGVAIVPNDLGGATASTGFCVIRPKPSQLDSRYTYHWVRSPAFVSEMVSLATGASYPAVSDKIVLGSRIPLPPLPEQRRIAAILDQADALRAQRREALAQLDRLTQAIFVEMFGDIAGNGWTITTVEAVAKPDKGSIRTGPFGSQLLHSEFVDKGIAVLGIDNAVKNEFRWGEARFISEQKYRELKRYKVLPGDLLITIMGTCGRCAVVPDGIPEAINTKHLCCITLDRAKCLPSFLHAYFLLHPVAREYLVQTAKGAVMDGLNMGIIKAMPVPLVPLLLQQTFATRIQAIEALKANHRTALTELNTLFTSLQHRAFRGEL